jgi:hypothetical protein
MLHNITRPLSAALHSPDATYLRQRMSKIDHPLEKKKRTGAAMKSATSQTDTNETLEQAQQRADRAERELDLLNQQPRPTRASATSDTEQQDPATGIDALRQDSMMAHLLDSLEQGKDIGHYGRLVFAMIASHFLAEDQIIDWLSRDADFDASKATAMLRQVEGRDYSPPRRERILEWQREQELPILPNADDPDCGNVYKSLKFPADVYEHIQNYQEEKAEAGT